MNTEKFEAELRTAWDEDANGPTPLVLVNYLIAGLSPIRCERSLIAEFPEGWRQSLREACVKHRCCEPNIDMPFRYLLERVQRWASGSPLTEADLSVRYECSETDGPERS